jgi:hypothetical protein
MGGEGITSTSLGKSQVNEVYVFHFDLQIKKVYPDQTSRSGKTILTDAVQYVNFGEGKPLFFDPAWAGTLFSHHALTTRARKYNWFQMGAKKPH